MIDRIALEPDDMDALLDDIEEFYNITLTGGEVVDTAGALEEVVVKKAAPQRVQLGGAVIDVFNRMRTAMLQIPGVVNNVRRPDKSWKITPATPLEKLLKGQDRHRIWHILRQGMGMQMPKLKLSTTQKFFIFVFLLSPLVALYLVTKVLHYEDFVDWIILTASVFPPMVAVLMARRFARSLPKGCETAGDLAALLVMLNLRMVKSHGMIGMDPFDQIRRLIAEHAECRPVDIERTTIIEG